MLHDGVKDVNNLVQVLDSLRLLELGYNGDGTSLLVHNLVDTVDVRAVSDEGQSNKVDASFESPAQVLLVLFGEGGNRHGNTGEVDALVVANRASDSAVTIDVVAAHRVNLEDGLAVVDEDDVAGLAVLGQTLESGGDALLIAHNVVSGDSELVTNLEIDLAVRLSFSLLEQAGTDLRTLEVGQGCHVETKFFRDRANQVKTLLVLGVVAVAHVETGNIHASLHELLHGVMAGHSGPKGIHNLSSTHAYTIPLKATRTRAGMPVTVGCTLDVHL